jgi:hypothetical protein
MECMECFRVNVGSVWAGCPVRDWTLQNVPEMPNPIQDPVEQAKTEIFAHPSFKGNGPTVPCWYAVLLTTAQ